MADNNRAALMDKIVSLCKRRGFIFQNSEIYGGQNGFWDYGPLGVELKRNVREAWWRDMVTLHDPLDPPAGAPTSFQMAGVETSIIMHPQVWKCSGHYDLFADTMVDCKSCHHRFREDQVMVAYIHVQEEGDQPLAVEAYVPDPSTGMGLSKTKLEKLAKEAGKNVGPDGFQPTDSSYVYTDLTSYRRVATAQGWLGRERNVPKCPDCGGELTEGRPFNLMFETNIGALIRDDSKAFLRPETAQGMFTNFKNIVDSSRVKVPFGVAQVGKSFRNEITPRNFTFRSREFEQMEMEFFCPPDQSRQWYEYWRDRRYNWYVSLGIESDNLILRDHEANELSHYSVGTADVEYQFPFLPEGEFGELEGIAHRGNFDLRSHMEGKLVKDDSGCLVVEQNEEGQPKYRGSGKDLTYYDDNAFERDKESLGVKSFKAYCEQRAGEADPGAPYRYIPHVIEPAAGADRATLAFICEAYFEDEQPDEKGNMQSRTVMRFHPRLAPIKVAVLPLIKKGGMPEKAKELFRDLKAAGIVAQYDEQAAIGRRYRRQDEIGTPWCITIDGETIDGDGTVTVRDRDTLEQSRLPMDQVVNEVSRRLRSS